MTQTYVILGNSYEWGDEPRSVGLIGTMESGDILNDLKQLAETAKTTFGHSGDEVVFGEGKKNLDEIYERYGLSGRFFGEVAAYAVFVQKDFEPMAWIAIPVKPMDKDEILRSA